MRAPSPAEVRQVAHLAVTILFATAIKGMRCKLAQSLRHGVPAGQLRLDQFRVLGVAEHIKIKRVELARFCHRSQIGFKAGHDACGVFVVHRHHYGRAAFQLVQIARVDAATPAQSERIQAQHLQHKADGATPKCDHDPTESDREKQQQRRFQKCRSVGA